MDLREVNLVPETVLRRRYFLRHAVAWALAYGLLGAILLAGHFCAQRLAGSRRTPVSEGEVRRRLAAAIAAIEEKKGALERLAFVRDVSPSLGPADILSLLAEATDPETWFTSISLDGQGSKNTVLVMEGLASSNARLGSTIRGISGDNRFHNVTLRNSSEDRRESNAGGVPQTVVRFSLAADVATR